MAQQKLCRRCKLPKEEPLLHDERCSWHSRNRVSIEDLPNASLSKTEVVPALRLAYEILDEMIEEADPTENPAVYRLRCDSLGEIRVILKAAELDDAERGT